MAPLVPLLLLTAFLSAKPSLCYINPAARLQQNVTTPSGRGTYIVLVEPPQLAHGDGEDDHRRWHESFLPPSQHADSDEPRLVHSYSEVFTGFAARLTEAELDAVSKKPGFLRAFPDQTLQLMTTHTPDRVRKRNSSSKSHSHPLLYSEEQRSCWFSDKGSVDGKIVVCQVWGSLLQNVLVNDLRRAGAAGVVLINDRINGYTTVLRDFGPDVVQVTVADGDSLAEYATSANSSATSTFKKTLLGVRPAPMVASFSSRGPSTLNPGVLKPDILAPGLNILAAWPPHGADKVGGSFKVLSGTSMATPHVSGVAALVKSSHPEWSPAAIKSAIMTSSDAVNSTGGPILDELHSKAGAYLTGAGHVNPMRAAHPGLVYDIGVIDYAGYICELLGDRALAIIMRNTSLSCGNLVKVPEPQLNYPTITVPVRSTPLTVNRTVTNVGPAKSTYTVEVKMAGSVTVRVWPETLVFSKAGEKKTFSVTVSGKIGEQEVVEGSLSWVSVSGKYVVRSPVVAISGSPHAHT
ncbi:hypothetical protein ABZP36_001938 [Zizania latifolia]